MRTSTGWTCDFVKDSEKCPEPATRRYITYWAGAPVDVCDDHRLAAATGRLDYRHKLPIISYASPTIQTQGSGVC